MLILTRTLGQQIMIGEDIQLTVLGTKGNQVRIGIEAPKDIPVHRQEVFDRLKIQELEKEKENGNTGRTA